MYMYDLLECGSYYLIQEKKSEPLIVLQVKVIIDSSMYVMKYKNTTVLEWKKKMDPIFDIVELLNEDAVKRWMEVYYTCESFARPNENEESHSIITPSKTIKNLPRFS